MNRIPENVDKVHLIAACGTGMGALACMLREMGITVRGSDRNVYPPMSTYLADKGVPVYEGFDAANLAWGPDLVVVGNAVKKDNPEVLRALEMNLDYCSMPQAVNRFLVGSKRAVVVAGTHGKTTTAAMIAWLLHYCGLSPSFMAGGFANNFSGSFCLGNGAHVVLEADEYDTAFFDKQPKFMHYTPSVAVLTSVEFDHADIYRDIEHVSSAFESFLSSMPEDSLLVSCDGDEQINKLLQGKSMKIERYGTLENSEWRLGGFKAEPPWTRFEVLHKGLPFAEFSAQIAGVHNLKNALAAVAAAHCLGAGTDAMAGAWKHFRGVRRRQEIRGVKNGVTVIDDFAHHPTAVRETISAVRLFYPKSRLAAVFEPRTNTSMRSVFQDEYPASFDMADIACIRKPPLLEKVPEGLRFSSGTLVSDIRKRGVEAYYFEDTDSIIDFLAASSAPGDVVLVMSNGGFDNIHERLLKALPEGGRSLS